MKKLKLIAEAVPEISYICLDVANGYSEHFVDCVRKARRDFPEHTIVVRDVVVTCEILLRTYIYIMFYMAVFKSSSPGGERGDWRNGGGTLTVRS